MTRIQLIDGGADGEQPDHQKKLALSLIENLGYEGAVHACRANSWDGVLRCVLMVRGPESAGAK